ncbi:unnamed protein product [Arabis nemorensis]|uniref:Uncharacterized protein n=1 Tax=Arabis nemorensis TaxID=586526 RepID=A0A565CAK3_9BRAS|nr:unnamed protein product [Arabis nemorensis]
MFEERCKGSGQEHKKRPKRDKDLPEKPRGRPTVTTVDRNLAEALPMAPPSSYSAPNPPPHKALPHTALDTISQTS